MKAYLVMYTNYAQLQVAIKESRAYFIKLLFFRAPSISTDQKTEQLLREIEELKKDNFELLGYIQELEDKRTTLETLNYRISGKDS